MSLVSASVHRPVSIGMIVAATVGLGLVSYSSLRVDLLPPVEIPKLSVETRLAGASAQQVEQAVTRPIETAIGSIEGLSRVTSTTQDGISVVTGDLEYGSDLPIAAIELREKLDQLRDILPPDATRPTIHRTDPSTSPIILVGVGWNGGVSGWQDTLVELRELVAAVVKRRLEQLEGVARALVVGGAGQEITILVDLDRLGSFGLGFESIARAVKSSNVNVSAGVVRMGSYLYPLRVSGRLATTDDVARISIGRTSSGRTIRVSDVATVRMGATRGNAITRLNGREVVAVRIHKETGGNTVDVSTRVQQALEELHGEYPELQFTLLADQAVVIQAAATDVKWSIFVGAVFASGVLLFVLHEVRFPVIIAATMVVSLLLTVGAMQVLGMSLNMMSLAGIAIAVGMLGDNAMVVIENVQRHLERNIPSMEAAVRGTRELSGALTASTLTNVAIFLPVMAVGGIARELFANLAVTMTVSLIASLIVALTLVPVLLSRTARGHMMAGRTSLWRPVSPRRGRWHEVVRRYLVWALRRPVVVLGGTGLLFAASLGGALVLPADMIPRLSVGGVQVMVDIPADHRIEQITQFAGTLERQIQSLPSVEMVYTEIGNSDEKLFPRGNLSPNHIAMLVRLGSSETAAAVIDTIRRVLTLEAHSLGGIRWTVEPEETLLEQILRPEREDVRVSVSGPMTTIRDSLAQLGFSKLRSMDGVADIRLSEGDNSEEMLFSIQPDVVNQYGLSTEEVATAIRHAIGGEHATDLVDFDRRTTVRVLALGHEMPSVVDALSSSMIVRGRSIPLREFVTFNVHPVAGTIVREDYQRVTAVAANLSSRSLESAADELQTWADTLRIPAGYHVRIGGENDAVERSLKTMLIVVLLSCGAVYLILGIQYESFLYPLVILLTGPLSLIGAVAAVVVAGGGYTLFSVLGIVIMIGAVDNDAVIVVDVIATLRKSGFGVHRAVVEGVLQRLRAIVMTSATSVLGVLPMFFSAGAGSKMLSGMSAPLVGGLLSSTMASIAVVPVVVALIERGCGRRRKE